MGMRLNEKTTIPFEGNYASMQTKGAQKALREILNEVLGSTQVWHIEIHGNDMMDGRESRSIDIRVESNNTITVKKNYS